MNVEIRVIVNKDVDEQEEMDELQEQLEQFTEKVFEYASSVIEIILHSKNGYYACTKVVFDVDKQSLSANFRPAMPIEPDTKNLPH